MYGMNYQSPLYVSASASLECVSIFFHSVVFLCLSLVSFFWQHPIWYNIVLRKLSVNTANEMLRTIFSLIFCCCLQLATDLQFVVSEGEHEQKSRSSRSGATRHKSHCAYKQSTERWMRKKWAVYEPSEKKLYSKSRFVIPTRTTLKREQKSLRARLNDRKKSSFFCSAVDAKEVFFSF